MFQLQFSRKTQENQKQATGGAFLAPIDARNLIVQPVPNEARDSLAIFLAKKKPPSDVVYKRVTSRLFVDSSFRNDIIWYNRCNFAGEFMNCVLINYPAAEKRQWDSVIASALAIRWPQSMTSHDGPV